MIIKARRRISPFCRASRDRDLDASRCRRHWSVALSYGFVRAERRGLEGAIIVFATFLQLRDQHMLGADACLEFNWSVTSALSLYIIIVFHTKLVLRGLEISATITFVLILGLRCETTGTHTC